MSEISVKELAVKTREAMRASGIAEYSLWRQYTENLLPVVRWFRKHGHEMFSEEVAYLYLDESAKRLNRGEIKRSYYLFKCRGATRMLEVYGCDAPEWSSKKRGSRYKFNGYYEKLLSEFSASENFNKNTLGDIVWVARKFFSWLCDNGYPTLLKVDADVIQQFVIHCSGAMKTNSLYNVKLYLKKLCIYLHGRSLLTNSYEHLLTFRVSREAKQFPTTSPEEIEAVLNLVDRNTVKGKRDYAMFMLAIVAGMRAVDITHLKLTDINWRKGEIYIVQSKTSQSLELPLTTDIGKALQDYILNGRPKVQVSEVFLRCDPPYRGFADAVSIGNAYDEYRNAAGFTRAPFDGKSFHSLRRTTGTNLITSDISLTEAAQILGKITPVSMKKYITLDSVHLKECALDFADIGIEGMI